MNSRKATAQRASMHAASGALLQGDGVARIGAGLCSMCRVLQHQQLAATVVRFKRTCPCADSSSRHVYPPYYLHHSTDSHSFTRHPAERHIPPSTAASNSSTPLLHPAALYLYSAFAWLAGTCWLASLVVQTLSHLRQLIARYGALARRCSSTTRIACHLLTLTMQTKASCG
jgi:hypothetical protein